MFIDHVHDQLGKHRIGLIDEAMPDFVKTAEYEIASEDLTKLADGFFAYSNGVDRYFPIHTAEHTWMSKAYFEKFAHQIDEREVENIRSRIDDAYSMFDLPAFELSKEASAEDELDSLHDLSIDMNNFIDNYKRLDINSRRLKAKEILAKAYALGKAHSVHDSVKRYSGDSLNKNYPIAFAKRMKYFHLGHPARKILLQMQERVDKDSRAEDVARALMTFDEKMGINKHYDNEIDDPFVDILSPYEEEAMMDICGHSIPCKKFNEFDFSSLSDILGDHIMSAMKIDPLSTIHQLDPNVRMIVIRKIHA